MPADAPDPTRQALQAIFADKERSRPLYLLAGRFARGTPLTAEDLVGDACLKVLGGNSPWVPEKHPDLRRHLGSVMYTVASNKRQSAAARHEELADEPGEEVRPKETDAVQAMRERDGVERIAWRLRHQLTALRARSDKDPESLALLDCFDQDVVTPGEQSERTGWGIEKVRTVRERLFDRAHKLAATLPDDSSSQPRIPVTS